MATLTKKRIGIIQTGSIVIGSGVIIVIVVLGLIF